jgi:hypothetical protein
MIQMKDLNCWVEYASDHLVHETIAMSKTSLPSCFDLDIDEV